MHGKCALCGKHEYLNPLHGDKGGPLCCILCAGKWHGEHGRRRRLGRVVIRAIAAYLDGGGKWADIELLRLSASGPAFSDFAWLDPLGYLADAATLGNGSIDLTSELLADAIKIAHPDLHPPERRNLAHRVTQGLLALQPFTFPAPKPKPPTPPNAPKPASGPRLDVPKMKAPSYPCSECASSGPYYYCSACRAELESRQQKQRERESAKRRKWYIGRKQAREYRKPPTICAACGAAFRGKRADARFCSATCRQRGHRTVTDKKVLPANHEISVTPAGVAGALIEVYADEVATGLEDCADPDRPILVHPPTRHCRAVGGFSK